MVDLSLSGPVPDCAEDGAWLACIECGETYAPFEEVIYECGACGSLLEVRYADYVAFDDLLGNGVWRYAAALPIRNIPASGILTVIPLKSRYAFTFAEPPFRATFPSMLTVAIAPDLTACVGPQYT